MTSRDRFLVYLALASALFVFIVAELLPVGLMPQMSADFQVEPSNIGLLVSAYAVTAAVLGLPVAWACRRWGNRVVLGGCLIWLAIGQIVLAVAPTLFVALVARIAVAGAHVVVWGIAVNVIVIWRGILMTLCRGVLHRGRQKVGHVLRCPHTSASLPLPLVAHSICCDPFSPSG